VIKRIVKNIDTFDKNLVIVFLGTSLGNVLSLIYQLVLAHRLTPVDFAAFNSLLSIFVLVATPLSTLNTAVVKYTSEFNARGQIGKVKALTSYLLQKTFVFGAFTFFIFSFASVYILRGLKIPSLYAGYLLAFLLAFSWINPVLSGVLQGLESFKWLMFVSLASGLLKLILTFLFIMLGYKIGGALGAFLFSVIFALVVSIMPLRRLLFSGNTSQENIDIREIVLYLCPVAVSYFCFMCLVNMDMLLVKYLFSPADAGYYSLAQIVGKVFLFLPGAICLVMFPAASGLSARDMDTALTLKKSLLYAAILCLLANIVYNICPGFILRLLSGKAIPEAILLARIFSVSMSFYALIYILISYFLSIKDLRFVKYLIFAVGLEFLGMKFFHKDLIEVQLVLCFNAVLVFAVIFFLAFFRTQKKSVIKTV